MANEAILIFETSVPIPFTVADAVAVEKGTLCALTDPMTASGAAAAGAYIAGIAKKEKIASDGITKLSMFREGIFSMTLSGDVIAGQAVCSHGNSNIIKFAPVTVSGAAIIGHALETGAEGENILVHVNVGAGGNQIS